MKAPTVSTRLMGPRGHRPHRASASYEDPPRPGSVSPQGAPAEVALRAFASERLDMSASATEAEDEASLDPA
jgi:hypothetical protein